MPIVEAVGAGVASVSGRSSLVKRIEQAMTDAIRDAYRDGISDPAEIRRRMMAARAAAKQQEQAAG